MINGELNEKNNTNKIWELIIIGAGPAGLTASIYACRSLIDTLLIEKLGSGGQASLTFHIENYPGFPEGINGFELGQKMEQQAKNFGVNIKLAEVKEIKMKENRLFEIINDESSYLTKSIIIATGTKPKRLGVKGEDDFIGRGISFCATCDAHFYREKIVAVVGGGDSAIDEGLFLTKFAKKVYIIHRRDQLRAAKILQQRAFSNPKIEFIWNSIVSEIIGDNKLREIIIKNVKDNSISKLSIDGLFLYIGLEPNTNFINFINKDENGYIITDEKMKTNIDGIFAAGDCRKTPLRQIITAASDGAIAAYSVEKYLEENYK